MIEDLLFSRTLYLYLRDLLPHRFSDIDSPSAYLPTSHRLPFIVDHHLGICLCKFLELVLRRSWQTSGEPVEANQAVGFPFRIFPRRFKLKPHAREHEGEAHCVNSSNCTNVEAGDLIGFL